MKVSFCVVFVLIGLTAVVLFSSCYFFTVYTYDVDFRNIGTRNLIVTSGVIGNYTPPVGVLNPGFTRSSSSHIGIPEFVTVKMKSENGKIVERNVKVKENLPSRFGNNDTIVFNITDNDEVILSFKRWGDKEIDSNGNEVNYKKASTAESVGLVEAV